MQVNALDDQGQSLGKQLVYKYTILFARVRNGFLHDFKFAENSSKFHEILFMLYLTIFEKNTDCVELTKNEETL